MPNGSFCFFIQQHQEPFFIHLGIKAVRLYSFVFYFCVWRTVICPVFVLYHLVIQQCLLRSHALVHLPLLCYVLLPICVHVNDFYTRVYNKTNKYYVKETCLLVNAFLMSLVLTKFNEGAYLAFKSVFCHALNVFQFDYEIMLESVPRTNQY